LFIYFLCTSFFLNWSLLLYLCNSSLCQRQADNNILRKYTLCRGYGAYIFSQSSFFILIEFSDILKMPGYPIFRYSWVRRPKGQNRWPLKPYTVYPFFSLSPNFRVWSNFRNSLIFIFADFRFSLNQTTVFADFAVILFSRTEVQQRK